MVSLDRLAYLINSMVFEKAGLRLSRYKGILNLCDTVIDPREGFYRSKGQPFVMNLSFSSGGDWLYSKYDSCSLSPYYHAAVAGINAKNEKDAHAAIYAILKTFSSRVVIKGPNELLGLDSFESSFNDSNKMWEMVLPWDNPDLKSLSAMRGKNIFEENLRYGLSSDRVLTDGVDVEGKLKVETQRIYDLLMSVKKNGLLVNDNNLISARIYIAKDSFVWRVSAGMHRAAILAALGWKNVPIKVDQLIRREDFNYWPGVTEGLYNVHTALDLFDRVFSGTAPSVFDEWKLYVECSLRGNVDNLPELSK